MLLRVVGAGGGSMADELVGEITRMSFGSPAEFKCQLSNALGSLSCLGFCLASLLSLSLSAASVGDSTLKWSGLF